MAVRNWKYRPFKRHNTIGRNRKHWENVHITHRDKVLPARRGSGIVNFQVTETHLHCPRSPNGIGLRHQTLAPSCGRFNFHYWYIFAAVKFVVAFLDCGGKVGDCHAGILHGKS